MGTAAFWRTDAKSRPFHFAPISISQKTVLIALQLLISFHSLSWVLTTTKRYVIKFTVSPNYLQSSSCSRKHPFGQSLNLLQISNSLSCTGTISTHWQMSSRLIPVCTFFLDSWKYGLRPYRCVVRFCMIWTATDFLPFRWSRTSPPPTYLRSLKVICFVVREGNPLILCALLMLSTFCRHCRRWPKSDLHISRLR